MNRNWLAHFESVSEDAGGPGIYTTPGRRRARRRHTGWRRIVLPKGKRLRAHDRGQGGWCDERHRGPSCSSWWAPSNAVGTPLPALPSEERKHEPRFLLPRSQATSLDREPADAEFLSRRGSLVADEW